MKRRLPPRLKRRSARTLTSGVCLCVSCAHMVTHMCLCKCQHAEVSVSTLYWEACLATLSLALGPPISLPFRIRLVNLQPLQRQGQNVTPFFLSFFPPFFLFCVLCPSVCHNVTIVPTQEVNTGSTTSLRRGRAHAQSKPVLHRALL